MPSASHRSPKLAPARPGRPSIARFLPYLKGYRWQFAFSFAMAPVGVGLSISIPLLLGGVVDGPISDGDVLGVLWFALGEPVQPGQQLSEPLRTETGRQLQPQRRDPRAQWRQQL